MYFCLTSHSTDRIPKWSESESVPLHFHLSPTYTSLEIIILRPLAFLVFHKILSFPPASERQKCLILSYLMSELFRLFLFPIGRCFGTVFYFPEISTSLELHRDEFEDSFHSYLVLFYIYSHLFLFALLSFLALKYVSLLPLFSMLCFLMRVPHFFPCMFFVLL